MAKALLGITVALLLGASVLGFLNKQKLEGIRTELSGAQGTLASIQQNLTQSDEAKKTAETAQAEAVAKQEQAEGDLAKSQQELQAAKNDANQLTAQIAEKTSAIADLEAKLASSSTGVIESTDSGINSVELEAKLSELEAQVSAAEEEKKVLTEKVTSAQKEADSLRIAEQKRAGSIMAKGLQGQIEAYNPAYNFVVLNIGDRQGAVANAEMIVTRGGTMVGKVRIASVYPTNSVADVVRNTVPKGVQIQPGDSVIYPGQ